MRLLGTFPAFGFMLNVTYPFIVTPQSIARVAWLWAAFPRRVVIDATTVPPGNEATADPPSRRSCGRTGSTFSGQHSGRNLSLPAALVHPRERRGDLDRLGRDLLAQDTFE